MQPGRRSVDSDELGEQIVEVMLEETMHYVANAMKQSTCVPHVRKHTEDLKSLVWVNRVLEGHHERSMDMFRMESSQFIKLRDMLMDMKYLQPTKEMHPNEALAIFLYGAGQGATNHNMQGRFERSSRIISNYYKEVARAVKKLQFEFIAIPNDSTHVPNKIRRNRDLYPYFKVSFLTSAVNVFLCYK
jgi:hypothetical protein